jgi:hypothetical protein
MPISAAASSSSGLRGQGRGARAAIACWWRIGPGTGPCSLYGFAKNERDNIDPDELQTLREIGAGWLAASPQQIERSLRENALQEVIDEDKEEA